MYEFDESNEHSRQGGSRGYVTILLIIRYLIVITLVPLILITRFVQSAHSVVLMAAQPLTDDRLVTYISICPGNIYGQTLAIELILTDRTCRSVHPRINCSKIVKIFRKCVLQLDDSRFIEKKFVVNDWRIKQISANFFRQPSHESSWRLVNNEPLSFPKWKRGGRLS